MIGPRPPADAAPPASCGCAHSVELHHPAGRCTVSLPEFLGDELPAWRCPCRGYRQAPAGPWRWHQPTQSWAAVPS